MLRSLKLCVGFLAVVALILRVPTDVHAQTSTYLYSRTIGSFGSGTGLGLTAGVAVDSSGNIFVGDFYGNRVVEFNSAGLYTKPFSATTNVVWGVAVDKSGNVYAVDRGNNRIVKFNSLAGIIQYIGPTVSVTPNVSINYPAGLALDSSGNIYLADSSNNRVVKFNAAGQSVFIFGSAAQLNTPRNVALDSSGNVYVADLNNNRVVEFNSSGAVVRTFGSFGTGNGQVRGPQGVAVDSIGNVYVSDTNGRIVEFDNNGNFLQNIGIAGSGDGQLTFPVSIAFDSTGNLYVAEYRNNRVLEFTQAICTGTITLDGIKLDGSKTDTDQNITFEFRPTGGGTPIIVKQVLKPTGKNTGTFAIANIPAGTYDVAIKGVCWQQALVSGVVISASGPYLFNPITLSSGDLNDDNMVDLADFGILVNHYGEIGAP